ncbi:YjdJ family protein [Peribacillus sp. SCS-155]|uniref:YjdJ family protein n=1 Tax=Peribacillus sedimenti TaxID=3115297 RepID=UPI003906392B
MSFKILIQLGLSIMFLLFSTFAAWYEGSQILDDPWEWKYSAIFSNFVHGQVENVREIIWVDHFVYAAKFMPAFPLLMLLSGTYLVFLVGYILFNRRHKVYFTFLTIIGVINLFLSWLLTSSSTEGLKMFQYSFLIIGILSIVISFMWILNKKDDIVIQ